MPGPTAGVLLALLIAAGCAEGPAPMPAVPATAPPIAAPEPPPVRAVTLDARERPSDAALDELAALGATHVAVIPFGWMAAMDAPAVELRTDPRWHVESDAGIRELAGRLESRGVGLILKPQLWIRGGGWSAEVAFDTDADWAAWEADYRALALHYAPLSAEVDADLFVVGTELAAAMHGREAFWRGLIAEVRGVYGGRLTVAANWYGDADTLPFWDALDLVGVQAYYPVSEEEEPTAADLARGWDGIGERLRALHEATGKPILLTELGYRSIGHAAAEPWRWPVRGETDTPEPALQADLYRAALGALWTMPFVEGVVLWKAHADPEPERYRLDFTWQGKPAEAVVADFFVTD